MTPDIHQRVCPNCGKSIEKGGHYMPPCMGDEGMWLCNQLNKLNEEAVRCWGKDCSNDSR